MSVRQRTFATVIALLLLGAPAMAEHFVIELTIISAGQKTTSSADTNTPQRPQGLKPRPVCHAKAGDDLTLQYFVTSNFPHDALKNVTICYFIVEEEKAGQDAVPPHDKEVLQGSFKMDFKPDTGKVGLRQAFKIDKPGTYLVRVESQNTDTDHEHFSALDLVVAP